MTGIFGVLAGPAVVSFVLLVLLLLFCPTRRSALAALLRPSSITAILLVLAGFLIDRAGQELVGAIVEPLGLLIASATCMRTRARSASRRHWMEPGLIWILDAVTNRRALVARHSRRQHAGSTDQAVRCSCALPKRREPPVSGGTTAVPVALAWRDLPVDRSCLVPGGGRSGSGFAAVGAGDRAPGLARCHDAPR
ncbi:hypothetical protein [Amycolatopsis sp. NPDC051372]|uniref:hypothetical protein n=1 Tax=Amycolatopsis sp. NPDC051372 TaxID=3155669 RepID=UPI00342B5C60